MRDMVTRRLFLRVSAAGAVGAWLAGAATTEAAAAGVPRADDAGRRPGPGAGLAPLLAATAIPQFRSALPIPAVMPKVGRRNAPRGPIDEYAVSARQVWQQMLPPPYPTTPVWAYGPAGDRSGRQHSSPAPTIVVEAEVPAQVRWVNELVDAAGRPLPHLLPVDPTLHWANPERLPGPDGTARTDMRPALTGRSYVPAGHYRDPATQYTTYRGPVPLVPHLHGAADVGDESDGYPEAWTLPAGVDQTTYAPYGAWYEFMRAKAARLHGLTWAAGEHVSHYPNGNRAGMLWYHDHAMGLTRLNVYAGLVGSYLVEGGHHGDGACRDRRTGAVAVLPEQLPMAIQDRAFRTDGTLFYPDSRAFFDAYAGPFYPTTPVPPVWNPEFFGNTIIVNGVVWPRHDVRRARYRLRILNGCDSRFLELNFGAIPGLVAWQIANEGGTLPAPYRLTAPGTGRLLLAPAERADVIVDFAGVAPGLHVLPNVAPDAPYPGDGTPADPATTGKVLAFWVIGGPVRDQTTPPEHLVLPAPDPVPPAGQTRRVALLEHLHTVPDHAHAEAGAGAGAEAGAEKPVAALLGIVEADPAGGPVRASPRGWMDPVAENPAVGATEVWEVYNLTADAHPIHLHQVLFEVVNRQELDREEDGSFRLAKKPPTPPGPGERGRKDTVVVWPDTVLRLRATFAVAGQYVWHCHLLSHEDNEMMRPFRVGPMQPGQPMAH